MSKKKRSRKKQKVYTIHWPVLLGLTFLLVAVVLAFRGKSLLTVALASCVTVFVTERILCLFL